MNPAQKITARIIAYLIFSYCNLTVYGTGTDLYGIGKADFQESPVKLPKPPKLPQEPKLPKPPKVPAKASANEKLIKKILNAFRFRHNAHARERARVLYIINQTLTDSLVVSKDDIRKLNDALEKRENQQFDSLMSLLNEIEFSFDNTI